MDKKEVRLVIQSKVDFDDETGEPLYWSNGIGWVDAESACRFSIEEATTVKLPVGGVWKRCPNQFGI